MKNTFVNWAGPLTKFTMSQSSRRPTRIAAVVGKMKLLAGRRGRTIGSRDASVTITVLRRRRAMYARRLDSPSRTCLRHQVLRWSNRLERVELARLLLIDRDRRQARVALVVDGERPEDPVRDLQPEEVLRDRRPGTVGLGDGVEHDVHRLSSVLGVRVRSRPDLVAEVRDERLALALQARRRLTGDAHVGAVEGRTVRLRIREPVRRDQRRVGNARLEVLDQLCTVVADDSAEEDPVRAGRLDRVRERLVARLLRIPALEARHRQAELIRRTAERRRDAEAVRLLVVEDEDLLEPDLLGVHRIRRPLDLVVRDNAGVVPRAGRVVLVRLTGLRAGAGRREPGTRVRRAHHAQRARVRTVQHRDDDLRAPGVERSDDADDALVPRVGAAVRRALGGVPRSCLRRRVVAGLVADLVLARLEAALVEGELDRIDHLRRLRTAGALE